LALVPYNANKNLYEKFAEELAKIKYIPTYKPVGAEKQCQSNHKSIFKNYLR